MPVFIDDDAPAKAPAAPVFIDDDVPSQKQQGPPESVLNTARQAWLRNGGDPAAADAMAHVAANESAGNPKIDDRVTGTHKGLWQISAGYSHKNLHDPDENARVAISLYNRRKAAGGTGLEDWEDSRDKGAFGGWGSFVASLNRPLAGTAEAAQAPVFIDDDVPAAAPAAPKPNTMPPQAPSGAPPAAPRAPAPAAPPSVVKPKLPTSATNSAQHQHSWLDQGFAIPDAPFILGNASFRGKTPQEHRENIVKALVQFVHDPAAANEEYGLGQRKQLETEKAGGDSSAQFWLDHPRTTGFVAGAAELVNPGQDVIGGPIGRGLHYVSRTPGGMALLHWAEHISSPYKGISPAGGLIGKRAMQAIVTKMGNAPAEAAHNAMRIFGDLSPSEQEDVVHVMQAQHVVDPLAAQASQNAIKTKNPARLAILNQRAKLLRDYSDKLDNRQLAAGTIKQQVVDDNPQHFGMAGIAENSHLRPEQRASLDRIGGPSGGGASSMVAPTTKNATYKTLAQLQAGAKGGIKQDFNVVDQALKNFTKAIKNATFEESAHHLPPGLIRPNTSRVRADVASAANVPKDGAGNFMVHWKDLEEDGRFHELAEHMKFSPSLKNAYISAPLVEFLQKNSTRLYNDAKLYEQFTPGSLAYRGFKLFNDLDNIQRGAIVANPLYHPVFNLSKNALAQGLPVHQVAGLVFNSLLHTFTGPKLARIVQEKMIGNYHGWLADALENGAVVTQARSPEQIQRMSVAWNDLNGWGKLHRLSDRASNFLSEAAMGQFGEEAFSTTLYKHLVTQGKFSPLEAGGLVREALGNYANVAKGSWQARIGFFYPWLKGNLSFWIQKLGTAAGLRAAAATQRGIRVNNSIVDDPDEKKNRAGDYQFIEHAGSGPLGLLNPDPKNFVRGKLPGAETALDDAAQLAGEKSPAGAAQKALNITANHLKPLYSIIPDMISTLAAPAADPKVPANFNTVMQKNAPGPEQLKQGAEYVTSKLLPVPGAGYAIKDAARTGAWPSTSALLQDAVTSIQAHPETNSKQLKPLYRAISTYDKQVKHNKGRPGEDKRNAAAYAKYIKKRDHLLSKLDRARPAAKTQPVFIDDDVAPKFIDDDIKP